MGKPDQGTRIMWACDRKASNIALFVILALLLPKNGIVAAQKENGKPKETNPKVSNDPLKGPGDSDALTLLKLKRSVLVNDLWDLQTLMDETLDKYEGNFNGKEDDIEKVKRDLKKKWNDIQDLSNQIFAHKSSIADPTEKEQEKKFQKELANDYAAVLFRAKARSCESAEETFYKPENKCIPFLENYDVSSNLCPKNQILFDIETKNEGICDCKLEPGLVFHGETKTCHYLNTQGPCKPNEWLLLVKESKNFPVCKSLPDVECPTDGKHVFYEKKCWELGKKGPCGDKSVLERNATTWIEAVCVTDSSGAGFSPSIIDAASGRVCRPGQSQTQAGTCRDQQ